MNNKNIILALMIAISLVAIVTYPNPALSIIYSDMTARVVWEYRETPDFYSSVMGDADRLPNGNTLVTIAARGRIVEVTKEGKKVWEAFFEETMVYRSERVPDLDLRTSILYNSTGYPTPRSIAVTHWNPEEACNGITFALIYDTYSHDETYLVGINMTGHVIWKYDGPWGEQKMLQNNHLFLVFPPPLQWAYEGIWGCVREIDLDGNVIFDVAIRNIHHDAIKPTDNNVLILAHVLRRSIGDDTTVVGDEIRLMNLWTKEVVWTWNTFDYLSTDHYCTICGSDWTHSNSITGLVENDQKVVYLSVRNLNQVIKIDYVTKTIIWKLGENGCFRTFEKNGTEVTKLFSHQHDPEILPNGNILLFDNGLHRDLHKPNTGYSRVIEIEITDPKTDKSTNAQSRCCFSAANYHNFSFNAKTQFLFPDLSDMHKYDRKDKYMKIFTSY